MKLDYRNCEDMEKLAYRVLQYGPSEELCAFITDMGLMRPRQWSYRFVFWLIRKWRGSTLVAWRILGQKSKGCQQQLINDMFGHILYGKDKTTTDAYGGLNQKEVDILVVGLNSLQQLGFIHKAFLDDDVA